MCEKLVRLVESDLRPFVRETMARFASEGQTRREKDLAELLATFDEIVADVEAGMMDEWECGELYEEFLRHRRSGEFLDRIC